MARRPEEIRKYLLQQLLDNNRSPVTSCAKVFGVSREAVHRHLQALIKEGVIRVIGRGRGMKYELVPTANLAKTYDLAMDRDEEIIWQGAALPGLADLPQVERDICHFGLTEMVNNAIDHSEGNQLLVKVLRTPVSVSLSVRDDGVGIFKKITTSLNLTDEKQAVLELTKGKVTTDPAHHTGEGIFFTSRVFDQFSIRSGNWMFHHSERDGDWLLEARPEPEVGTAVFMNLLIPCSRTLPAVFAEYSSGPDEYSFTRTKIPLSLATFVDENLVSRSQARRVLARVERFREVILDFAGVRSIGQAFADETFRVFRSQNPDVSLTPVNANEDVKRMIRRAMAPGLIQFVPLTGDPSIPDDKLVFRDPVRSRSWSFEIGEISPSTLHRYGQIVQVEAIDMRGFEARVSPARLTEYQRSREEEVARLIVGLYLQRSGRLPGTMIIRSVLPDIQEESASKLATMMEEEEIEHFVEEHKHLWMV